MSRIPLLFRAGMGYNARNLLNFIMSEYPGKYEAYLHDDFKKVDLSLFPPHCYEVGNPSIIGAHEIPCHVPISDITWNKDTYIFALHDLALVTHKGEDAAKILDGHDQWVMKPVAGSGSKQIHIVKSIEEVGNIVESRNSLKSWIFQEYAPGEEELVVDLVVSNSTIIKWTGRISKRRENGKDVECEPFSLIKQDELAIDIDNAITVVGNLLRQQGFDDSGAMNIQFRKLNGKWKIQEIDLRWSGSMAEFTSTEVVRYMFEAYMNATRHYIHHRLPYCNFRRDK